MDRVFDEAVSSGIGIMRVGFYHFNYYVAEVIFVRGKEMRRLNVGIKNQKNTASSRKANKHRKIIRLDQEKKNRKKRKKKNGEMAEICVWPLPKNYQGTLPVRTVLVKCCKKKEGNRITSRISRRTGRTGDQKD